MGRPGTSAVGDLLRHYRVRLGLTQEDLTERVSGGISVDTISNIERGRVRPHRHTLLELLDALGVDERDRGAVLSSWRTSPRAIQPGAVPTVASHPPATHLPPLIGRQSELADLIALLRRPD